MGGNNLCTFSICSCGRTVCTFGLTCRLIISFSTKKHFSLLKFASKRKYVVNNIVSMWSTKYTEKWKLCPVRNKRNLGSQAKRQQLNCCHGITLFEISRILFYNMICEFSVLSLLFGLLYFLLPTTCSSDKEHLSLSLFFLMYTFLVWFWVI